MNLQGKKPDIELHMICSRDYIKHKIPSEEREKLQLQKMADDGIARFRNFKIPFNNSELEIIWTHRNQITLSKDAKLVVFISSLENNPDYIINWIKINYEEAISLFDQVIDHLYLTVQM